MATLHALACTGKQGRVVNICRVARDREPDSGPDMADTSVTMPETTRVHDVCKAQPRGQHSGRRGRWSGGRALGLNGRALLPDVESEIALC